MTTDDATAATNGDDPQTARLIPPGNPESMLQLRTELSELAHTLPGDLRRLRVRGGDREIEVEWGDPVQAPTQRVDQPRTSFPGEAGNITTEASLPAPDGLLTAVRAPLVGCYFAAPSPGAEPFVQVGDAVEPGTTVAIIEAMKLMNAIVAGESGVVAEVLVSNGDSVEYDQILLRLRPTEQAA